MAYRKHTTGQRVNSLTVVIFTLVNCRALPQYTHMASGDTQATPQEQQHMYISKAKHYAISRAIFNLEMAVRDDNSEARWDMYDVLRELGIDHMFHEMPEHVQNKGDDLFYKARYYPHQLREA